MRVGIVAGKYHKDIAEAMVSDALGMARQVQVVVDPVVWVAGSYEVPLVVQELLERKDIDAVVVIGYIEKGETLHGEQMGLTVARLLKEMELKHRKPVGMGIIGPGATAAQARKRIGYGAAALVAAVDAAKVLQGLKA